MYAPRNVGKLDGESCLSSRTTRRHLDIRCWKKCANAIYMLYYSTLVVDDVHTRFTMSNSFSQLSSEDKKRALRAQIDRVQQRIEDLEAQIRDMQDQLAGTVELRDSDVMNGYRRMNADYSPQQRRRRERSRSPLRRKTSMTITTK